MMRNPVLTTTANVLGGVALAALLSGGSAFAKPPGSWSVSNDQGTVKIDMALTTLADGTVLMTGGGDAQLAVKDVQIFTPATSSWALVAPMRIERQQHTATLLADGTVLVAGGSASGTQAAPVIPGEIYNPKKDKWTRVGDMVQPRFDAMAVLLKTGKVLICGGTQNVDVNLSSCELYDPAARSFALTGDMGSGRRESAMITLANGDVFLDGDDGGAIIYSVSKASWHAAATPPAINFAMTLTLLSNGRVMETPSHNSGTQKTEIYDPKSDSWTVVGNALARNYNASATLANGLVLTMGGCIFGCSKQNIQTANLYNPATGKWGVAPSMNFGREDHSAVTLSDGRVLVVGGGASPEIYTY